MCAAEDTRYDRGASVPFGVCESQEDNERLAKDVTLFQRELQDANRFRRKLEELVKRVEALEQSLKRQQRSAGFARAKSRHTPNKKGTRGRRTTTAHVR